MPTDRQLVAMSEAKLRQYMAANELTVPNADAVAWLMDNCQGDYYRASVAVQNVQADAPQGGE